MDRPSSASAWSWNLPDGVVVSLDVSPEGVESVKLGPRLVSRSAPGGKPGGHEVRLPALASGADGARLEIVFDPRRGVPTLRADGREVAPTRVAGSMAAPGAGGEEGGLPAGKSVLGERLGGAALCFLLAAGLSLYVRGVVDDAIAGEDSVRFSMKLVGLCPGFAVMGLGLLVAPRSVFESSARARVTGQLTGAGLVFTLVVGALAIVAGLAAYVFLVGYLESRGYRVG